MNLTALSMKTNSLLVRSALVGVATLALTAAFGAVSAFAAIALTGVLVIAANDYAAPARRWQPALARVAASSSSSLRLAA